MTTTLNAAPCPPSVAGPKPEWWDGRSASWFTGRAGLLVAFHKMATLAIVLLGLAMLPIFNDARFEAVGQHWPETGGATWATRFATWDAAHYLRLSIAGYEAGSPSCAFYPLLPLLIRLGAIFTLGHPVVAGMLLCNAASFAGLFLFFQLIKQTADSKTAFCSLLVLLSFPGAIFFSFIYTEPLFFLLAMLFFHALFRKNHAALAVAGFLLPLTRAIGVFVVAPLAWHLFQEGQLRKRWPVLLLPLAGYGSYFVVMLLFTGNPFEGFEAQNYFPNHPSVGNILNVPGFMASITDARRLHGFTDSILDRLFFFIFVLSLPALWTHQKTYFLYALASGLVPAMSNWFFSYSRFVMMCFPLFLFLGARMAKATRPVPWCAGLVVMFSIQIIFLIRHINYYWAG